MCLLYLSVILAAVPLHACDGKGANVNSHTFTHQTQHSGPADRSHTQSCAHSLVQHTDTQDSCFISIYLKLVESIPYLSQKQDIMTWMLDHQHLSVEIVTLVELFMHLAHILASTEGPGSWPRSATQIFHELKVNLSIWKEYT